ncbi:MULTISPECIES: glycoside hydrolase family 2 protein [Dyadobacter]|uniref:Beta-galactosidase n=1 Tax=Dyadobacter chenhuakuii TaxID=2909339 RepID=A0ABY4XSF8_9BACT|nr:MULTISPECIES: sugar-binding domain-containing protein [Dyadobacter]MCF2492645.1 beta-galactosidase [Dyadobacter chenhuakuii]MCF2520339.1 beta-galactosidase [Dyadobacter sp. CY351]USJ33062.1 beta-galactosidase [Dyadobacter chenhuakuii]
MKTALLGLGLLSCILSVDSAAQKSPEWKYVEGKIVSPWAEKVNAANVHPEYPRPQMVRQNWVNINGLWNFSIVPKQSSETKPAAFDGQILVPFAVESALSGVGKTVGKDSVLWYQRNIDFAPKLKDQRVLLHFGAVDWKCDVFVNGKPAGSHQGGYDPFSFDITDLLVKKKQQDISVRVWDPSSDGPQPRGKQIKNPHAIWYTPVTGIWQTVWLETVPTTHIADFKQVPDIDKQTLTVTTTLKNAGTTDKIRIVALDGSNKVAEQEIASGENAVLNIANAKLWSPENPFLYDLVLTVTRNGKVVDEVKSYFAMRKISMQLDANGIQRMALNNKFLFQYGPLDQGWWPDGLYTAPTDEALKFDILKTKEMGFNMIRKHVKVEPARWYRYCDELGMLVWQDMPSGDMGNNWEQRPGITGDETEKQRTPESENIYKTEWKAIMDANDHFPSIVVWVPFNEAWGQFKTEEITNWTMQYDPSRLVNSASGGNFFPVGHIIDMHNYPAPVMPRPEIFGAKQIIVLGEFGGLGLPIDGHVWQQKDNWGYQSFKNQQELYARYESFVKRFESLIKRGLSAAVYTQTTDVEIETNGLMTYDRKVIKFPEAKLKAIHMPLYNADWVKLKP